MDAAFVSNNHEAIIKSAQNPCDVTTEAELLVFREATSLRQYAEWGMHAYSSSFPCLNEHIPYEEHGERLTILHLAIFLYNFRCANVALNQICNLYVANWAIHANAYVIPDND